MDFQQFPKYEEKISLEIWWTHARVIIGIVGMLIVGGGLTACRRHIGNTFQTATEYCNGGRVVNNYIQNILKK